MLSPFPLSPVVSSVFSLTFSSGGAEISSPFSGISSTSWLSDGSGASDLSDRPDRRSEYLPSASFPFLSSFFFFF